MNLSKGLKFTLAIVAQVLIILVIVIIKMSVLTSGTEVLLRLAPVDPRDPLRGDYMTVNYDISSIYSSYFNDKDIKNGDTVYVPLVKGGKFWYVTYGVTKTKPDASSATTAPSPGMYGESGLYSNEKPVYIKGKVISGGNASSGGFERMNDIMVPWQGSGNIQVAYNIENYFIPEGTGSAFPTGLGGSDSFALVAIGDGGDAVLKTLYVDNKPWPQGGKELELGPELTPEPAVNSQWNNQPANNSNMMGGAEMVESELIYENTLLGYRIIYPSNVVYTEGAYFPSTKTQSVTFKYTNSFSDVVYFYNDPNTYGFATLDEYMEALVLSSGEVKGKTVVNNLPAFEVFGEVTARTYFMRPSDKQIFVFSMWTYNNEQDRRLYNQLMEKFSFE